VLLSVLELSCIVIQAVLLKSLALEFFKVTHSIADLLPSYIYSASLQLEPGMNLPALTSWQGSGFLFVKWDNLVSHRHVLELKSLFAVSTEYFR